MTPPQMLTARDVADLLRCHEKTVRRMINNGDIPARMIAGKWLIHPDDAVPPAATTPPPERRWTPTQPGPISQAARDIIKERRAVRDAGTTSDA